MTTTTTMPTRARPAPLGGAAVVLNGISWDVYESLLAQLERANQKMYLTYDRGTLEIMPPSNFHEKHKKLLARCVEAMCMEMAIPLASAGSATFRREDVERGLEPDECYYVQHEPQMAARFDKIDLMRDPPPDLALEMDHTSHAVDRESVYAGLGVPEIWSFNGDRLEGQVRDPAGQYHRIEVSAAFPFLRLADLERFLKLARTLGEHAAVMAFRDWVRQTHRRTP